MGGKSKSKQSTQTTTHNESNVNNIALSGIEDGGAGVLGDDNMSNTGSAYDGSVLVTGENNNVTVTDGGAFGLVEEAGAEALGFSDLGTFEKGKTPGVILIQKLTDTKLSESSIVKKLQ